VFTHPTGRQPLKTDESRRAVDIPPPLMRRLLKLVDDRGARFTPNALVFASRNGTGLQRKVAREALKRAAKAAKLSDPQPTLHDLRHSHASTLIAMDFSVVDVQRRLGHRKPDITLRIYAHEWKYRDAQRSQIGRANRPRLPRRRPKGTHSGRNEGITARAAARTLTCACRPQAAPELTAGSGLRCHACSANAPAPSPRDSVKGSKT
jgi:hypothetical protein